MTIKLSHCLDLEKKKINGEQTPYKITLCVHYSTHFNFSVFVLLINLKNKDKACKRTNALNYLSSFVQIDLHIGEKATRRSNSNTQLQEKSSTRASPIF
jgi:hypothetical protein